MAPYGVTVERDHARRQHAARPDRLADVARRSRRKAARSTAQILRDPVHVAEFGCFLASPEAAGHLRPDVPGPRRHDRARQHLAGRAHLAARRPRLHRRRARRRAPPRCRRQSRRPPPAEWTAARTPWPDNVANDTIRWRSRPCEEGFGALSMAVGSAIRRSGTATGLWAAARGRGRLGGRRRSRGRRASAPPRRPPAPLRPLPPRSSRYSVSLATPWVRMTT